MGVSELLLLVVMVSVCSATKNNLPRNTSTGSTFLNKLGVGTNTTGNLNGFFILIPNFSQNQSQFKNTKTSVNLCQELHPQDHKLGLQAKGLWNWIVQNICCFSFSVRVPESNLSTKYDYGDASVAFESKTETTTHGTTQVPSGIANHIVTNIDNSIRTFKDETKLPLISSPTTSIGNSTNLFKQITEKVSSAYTTSSTSSKFSNKIPVRNLIGKKSTMSLSTDITKESSDTKRNIVSSSRGTENSSPTRLGTKKVLDEHTTCSNSDIEISDTSDASGGGSKLPTITSPVDGTTDSSNSTNLTKDYRKPSSSERNFKPNIDEAKAFDYIGKLLASFSVDSSTELSNVVSTVTTLDFGANLSVTDKTRESTAVSFLDGPSTTSVSGKNKTFSTVYLSTDKTSTYNKSETSTFVTSFEFADVTSTTKNHLVDSTKQKDTTKTSNKNQKGLEPFSPLVNFRSFPFLNKIANVAISKLLKAILPFTNSKNSSALELLSKIDQFLSGDDSQTTTTLTSSSKVTEIPLKCGTETSVTDSIVTSADQLMNSSTMGSLVNSTGSETSSKKYLGEELSDDATEIYKDTRKSSRPYFLDRQASKSSSSSTHSWSAFTLDASTETVAQNAELTTSFFSDNQGTGSASNNSTRPVLNDGLSTKTSNNSTRPVLNDGLSTKTYEETPTPSATETTRNSNNWSSSVVINNSTGSTDSLGTDSDAVSDVNIESSILPYFFTNHSTDVETSTISKSNAFEISTKTTKTSTAKVPVIQSDEDSKSTGTTFEASSITKIPSSTETSITDVTAISSKTTSNSNTLASKLIQETNLETSKYDSTLTTELYQATSNGTTNKDILTVSISDLNTASTFEDVIVSTSAPTTENAVDGNTKVPLTSVNHDATTNQTVAWSVFRYGVEQLSDTTGTFDLITDSMYDESFLTSTSTSEKSEFRTATTIEPSTLTYLSNGATKSALHNDSKSVNLTTSHRSVTQMSTTASLGLAENKISKCGHIVTKQLPDCKCNSTNTRTADSSFESEIVFRVVSTDSSRHVLPAWWRAFFGNKQFGGNKSKTLRVLYGSDETPFITFY